MQKNMFGTFEQKENLPQEMKVMLRPTYVHTLYFFSNLQSSIAANFFKPGSFLG